VRAQLWQQRYLERFYNTADGWVDGTTEFHALCREKIPRTGKILEIGPGATNPTSAFLASLGDLHGIDPDPDVLSNANLASASVLDSPTFPFESASFDACVSNYVIEHIEDPLNHLTEVTRILKPGGVYVFRTPNRFHYVAIAAWLMPHWVHERAANRLRNLLEYAHGPHRTTYALNSRAAIERYARKVGLQVETLRYVEKEPSYGMSSPLLFLAFTAYERLVNASESLAFLRANIFGALRKPSVRRIDSALSSADRPGLVPRLSLH
jgi:SAM-dependent methyltransferase